MKHLNPSDDELAFLIGHELSHVVHGHGQQALDETANQATLQLVVLGMIDPTGIAAFALSGLSSLWLSSQKAVHSREHESEADHTGLSICSRACFSVDASTSLMRKLHGDRMQEHAGWLDTHPTGPERIAALERQAANDMLVDGRAAHARCGAQKRSMLAGWSGRA